VAIKVSLFGTAAGAAEGVAFLVTFDEFDERETLPFFCPPPASRQDFLVPPPVPGAARRPRRAFLGHQVEELTGFRQGRCSLNLPQEQVSKLFPLNARRDPDPRSVCDTDTFTHM
jgi:hypothetical protein